MREVTTKFLAFFNPNRKLVNPCSRASIIGTSFGTTAGGVWNQLLRRATYEQDTSLASIRREGLRPNRLNRCLFSSASLSKPVDGCAHWQLDTIGTSMNPWLTSSFVHVTSLSSTQMVQCGTPSPSHETNVYISICLCDAFEVVADATTARQPPGQRRQNPVREHSGQS